MEIVAMALDQETFAFHGKHFDLPPPGIPDRGSTVQELTLIPRPKYPYEVWRAVTSPPTLEQVARRGHGAVFWLRYHGLLHDARERFEDVASEQTDTPSAPGAPRMAVLDTRIR